MDIQDIWEKALSNTRIIRPRVQELLTFATTKLPYMFLAESSVNLGDTVVRRGEILVEKPSLIVPSDMPQFEGFGFEEEFHLNEDTLTNFLLVRGVNFQSLKYNNKTNSVNIYEGGLDAAIEFYLKRMQKEENVHTGLLSGPEDCWQFSILIFICTQITRSAEGDIRKILDKFRRRNK